MPCVRLSKGHPDLGARPSRWSRQVDPQGWRSCLSCRRPRPARRLARRVGQQRSRASEPPTDVQRRVIAQPFECPSSWPNPTTALCPMVSPDGHIMTSWSMHHTRLSTKDHGSASGRRFGRYSWAVTINPRSRSLLPVPIQQCGTGCMVGPVAAPTFWTGTKRWPRDRLRTLGRHTFRSEAWRDVDAMRSAKGAEPTGFGVRVPDGAPDTHVKSPAGAAGLFCCPPAVTREGQTCGPFERRGCRSAPWPRPR